MLNNFVERLRQELETKLPALKDLIAKDELQKLLESSLRHLNLVTREEFDAQTAVLLRTRMLLEDIEKRCAELEAQGKSH